MTWLLDTRDDGSVALFIDGTIQFDSRDERIYHEGLVGPALSLQLHPDRKPISALIIGGGDGLVARELLKHPSVQSVDLVDRDEGITSMASTNSDWLKINCRSLLDDRLKVTTCDAWDFVEQSKQMYDLIISDLTVPQSRAETRMHSVEWYTRLRALLNECGSLAANSASPCQNPRAFWSITNSVRRAGLCARPYRVSIPSFTQRGHGPDWGFVLASMSPLSDWQKRTLRANEDDISSAQSMSDGRPSRLTFRFPDQVADVRHLAPPIAAETNDLLDSFRIANYVKAPWQMEWDALEALLEVEPLLEVQLNDLLLPATVASLLKTTDKGDQLLFAKLGMIMPGLSAFQSPDMVADFLSLPFRLLKSIDLQSLINSLVARSIELPQAILDELLYLRDTLCSLNFENIDLLAVSSRVLSIITLVVVISNLVSPDAAYGKGGGGGHSGGGGGHSGGFGGGHFGGFGGGHFGGGCGHLGGFGGGHFGGIATSHGASPGGLYCHSGNFGNHFSWYGLCHHGSAFSQQCFGGGYPINVLGSRCNRAYFNIYPSQVYFNFPLQIPNIQPVAEAPPFMLADNVYILPDGTIAIVLSEKVGLLLGRRYNTVVDIKTGQPLMQLLANQDEIHMLIGNLDQQLSSLSQESRRRQALQTWASTASVSTYTSNPNQAEIDNIASTITLLSQAKEQLSVEAVIKQPGTTSDSTASTATESTEKPASSDTNEIVPTGKTASASSTSTSNGGALPKVVSEGSDKADPLTNTAELFPGVSVDHDGRFIVLRLPDNTYAYMNGLAWYVDPQMTKVIPAPYPRDFGKFIGDYTKEQIRGGGHVMKEQEKELDVATSHLDTLRKEQATYLEKQAKHGPEDEKTVMVRYGISKIPVAEALTKIEKDIVSAKAAADAIDKRKGDDMTRFNMLRSLQNTFKLGGRT